MDLLHREQLYLKMFASFQSIHKGMVPKSASVHKVLPYSQRLALFYIAIHSPTNVKHLSKVLYITSGAVTQLVDSLVQASLVERNEDPQDRRSVIITLSDLGQAFMKDVEKESIESMHEIFKNISDKELVSFVSTLQKIGKNK